MHLQIFLNIFHLHCFFDYIVFLNPLYFTIFLIIKVFYLQFVSCEKEDSKSDSRAEDFKDDDVKVPETDDLNKKEDSGNCLAFLKLFIA